MSRINEILNVIEQDLSEANTQLLYADISKTCRGDRTNAFAILCQKRGFSIHENLGALQAASKDLRAFRSLLGGCFMHEVALHYRVYL